MISPFQQPTPASVDKGDSGLSTHVETKTRNEHAGVSHVIDGRLYGGCCGCLGGWNMRRVLDTGSTTKIIPAELLGTLKTS